MEDAMKIWNGYVHEHKELSYKVHNIDSYLLIDSYETLA